MARSLLRRSVPFAAPLALAGLCGGCSQPAPSASAGKDPFAIKTYAEVCAGCHGTDRTGGRAPAILDPATLSGLSDARIHAIIAKGVQGTEMPAFGSTYSAMQINRLIAYLRSGAGAAPVVEQRSAGRDPDGVVVDSKVQAVRMTVLTDKLVTPWGLAFLPDGRLLVTERPGRLRVIDRAGKLDPHPVAGLPQVWVHQDAGLLDVAVDPDYAHNGLIYIAYCDAIAESGGEPGGAATVLPGEDGVKPSMTVIIRGRIDAHGTWHTDREIFRAPAALYTRSPVHYGSRLLFDHSGHLFFTIGDRGDMTNAQRLDTPLGKIHRVNTDGTVPRDNPFVGKAGAVPTIWSYGHRNPEGLAIDPRSGTLWESEHGPKGGDEINVIVKGHNYGWGVVSMGEQSGITRRSAPGMDDPIAWYTPTVAPSGIHFYAGERYTGWKNDLFVACLAGQQLRRLTIAGNRITGQEAVIHDWGRVRAVATGPDGLLYALVQGPTGPGTGLALSADTQGRLIRLDPVHP